MLRQDIEWKGTIEGRRCRAGGNGWTEEFAEGNALRPETLLGRKKRPDSAYVQGLVTLLAVVNSVEAYTVV